MSVTDNDIRKVQITTWNKLWRIIAARVAQAQEEQLHISTNAATERDQERSADKIGS